MPRSPQGHPVLIQAGSSGPGQALAARIADVVFTAQNDLDEAQAFYRGVKAQVAGFGRPADEVLVMPGVFPVIGRTEAEAQEIFAELNRNIDTAQAFTVLSERLGADMSVHPLDGPVPELPETEHLKSRAALLIEMARRDKLTLRQLYYRVAAARGHLLLIGTAAEIADVLEAWFRAGAADGFNVMPPFFPGQFDAFVDEVVPLLQERGLFRADYAGTTLRDHLGLSGPAAWRSAIASAMHDSSLRIIINSRLQRSDDGPSNTGTAHSRQTRADSPVVDFPWPTARPCWPASASCASGTAATPTACGSPRRALPHQVATRREFGLRNQGVGGRAQTPQRATFGPCAVAELLI